MNELLNLSRKISESQDYMTNEQYNMFVDNLANFSEEEQKESEPPVITGGLLYP